MGRNFRFIKSFKKQLVDTQTLLHVYKNNKLNSYINSQLKNKEKKLIEFISTWTKLTALQNEKDKLLEEKNLLRLPLCTIALKILELKINHLNILIIKEYNHINI